jgi:hypothetical protein
MSGIAPDRLTAVVAPEWDELELEVQQLIGECAAWRGRALAAGRRIAELETAVRSIADGSLDPLVVAERLENAEAENIALRDRLRRAHDAVGRIRARIDFLQEER